MGKIDENKTPTKTPLPPLRAQMASSQRGSLDLPGVQESALANVKDGEEMTKNDPISRLNFSVRIRKCMNRLGVVSISDLIAYSADELLELKNFGMVSLTEVRNKIKGLDLKLREDE